MIRAIVARRRAYFGNDVNCMPAEEHPDDAEGMGLDRAIVSRKLKASF